MAKRKPKTSYNHPNGAQENKAINPKVPWYETTRTQHIKYALLLRTLNGRTSKLN